MKLIHITASVMGLATSAFATNPAVNQVEYCSERQDNNYEQELLSYYKNRMSFRNRGGLINGCVCWWHSRFLRNATISWTSLITIPSK